MRSVDPRDAGRKVHLRPAPAPDPEEQVRLRLQQMIQGRVDAVLLASIDQYIAQRVDAVVQELLPGIMLAQPATTPEPPVAHVQRLLAEKFDVASVDAAIRAIVETRIEDLYGLATGSRAAPGEPTPAITEPVGPGASTVPPEVQQPDLPTEPDPRLARVQMGGGRRLPSKRLDD